MGMVLGMVVMLALPAYFWAQYRALVSWRGWPLWLSFVPAAVMAALFVVTILGFARGANLAPLMLILAAPVALVTLGLISLFRRTPRHG